MNSTLVRKLAFFAAGALIGGVAGYFTGKFIADRFSTNGDAEEMVETGDEDSNEIVPAASNEKPSNGKTNKVETYIPVEYSAIRSKPSIEDLTKKYAPVKPEDMEIQKFPYLITMEQYDEECLAYDEVSLIYYAGDDTLSDRGDEIIVDRQSVVGLEWLKNFGFGNDDKDIVYVRNDRTSTKYEISRVAESYKEVVGGGEIEPEEDEEPKPPSRKGKAKKNGPKVNGETSS